MARMTEPNGNEFLNFQAGGFRLFLPPAQMGGHSKLAQFVMLDDQNDKFYGVDFETAAFANNSTWEDLAIQNEDEPALVFPPNAWSTSGEKGRGFLVTILSHDSDVLAAVKVGLVDVIRYPQEKMNWGALESLKGPELPAELRNGLMRHLYDRRPGAQARHLTYVTPQDILDEMSRPWHRRAEELNWQLDSKFAAGKVIEPQQRWKLFA